MSQNNSSENIHPPKQQRSTRSVFRTAIFIFTFMLLMVMSYFIFSPSSSQWMTNNNNQDNDHHHHFDGDDHHSHFLKSSSFDNSTTSFIRHFILGDLQTMMDQDPNNNNDDVDDDNVGLEKNDSNISNKNPPQLFADEQFPGFYSRMMSHPRRNLKSSNSNNSNNNDLWPMETCRFQRQFYWNFFSKSCLPLTSSSSNDTNQEESLQQQQELKCSNKNVMMKTSKKKSSDDDDDDEIEEWKPIGYWKDKNISTPFDFESDKNYFLNSTRVRDIYRNFQFATSWMFREWKYWKPHPRFVNSSTSASNFDEDHIDFNNSENFHIRGRHQPALENLFVLENFCLEPFSGISGYFTPQQSIIEDAPNNPLLPYKGKDDTRNYFHGEKTFMSFFHSQRIHKLVLPPKIFDDRLVIFHRIAPISRYHIYHTLNRFMNLLGILRKVVRPTTSNSDVTANTNNNKIITPVDPLLVLVNEPMDNHYDSVRTPSFGYFYQLLTNIPWAAVTVPNHITEVVGAKMDIMNYVSPNVGDYHKKLFDLTGHNYSDDFFRRVSENRKEFRVCFRKAVLYQNCYECGRSHANRDQIDMSVDYEKESYSFGIWQVADAPRISLVNHYRQLVDSCLLLSSSSPVQEQQKQRYRLPTVLFASRTQLRRIIRDFPLIVDVLRYALVENSEIVDDILFREPFFISSSSASQKMNDNKNMMINNKNFSEISYLNDIRHRADIFVGMHGGDFAMTSLMMKNNGVVIEYTIDEATCRYDDGHNTKNSSEHEEIMRNKQRSNNKSSSDTHFINLPNPKRCWFGIFADAVKADHWLFLMNRFGYSRKQFVVPPNLFIDTIREGACRWLFKKYGSDPDVRVRIGRFDPEKFLRRERMRNQTSANSNGWLKTVKQNVLKNSKILARKMARRKVVRAMWSCLMIEKERNQIKKRKSSAKNKKNDDDHHEGELSSIIVPWNKRVRIETVLDPVINVTTNDGVPRIQNFDPRFLRFLWFTFTSNNVDVSPQRISKFVSVFTRRLNSRISNLSSSSSSSSSENRFPKLFATPSSSVSLWNSILTRLLLKDEGDKIFENSQEEEKFEKKDERFLVRGKWDDSIPKKIGCLPLDETTESCLFVG